MIRVLVPTDFSPSAISSCHSFGQIMAHEELYFFFLYSGEFGSPHQADLLMQEWVEQLQEKMTRKFTWDYEYRSGPLIRSIRLALDIFPAQFLLHCNAITSAGYETIQTREIREVLQKIKCNQLIMPDTLTVKPINKILLLTDFRSELGNSLFLTLKTLDHEHRIRILIMHTGPDILRPDLRQQNNRLILENYLGQRVLGFTQLNSGNRIEDLEHTLHRFNFELVIIPARNLNYMNTFLLNSSKTNHIRHQDIPILVLHEMD